MHLAATLMNCVWAGAHASSRRVSSNRMGFKQMHIQGPTVGALVHCKLSELAAHITTLYDTWAATEALSSLEARMQAAMDMHGGQTSPYDPSASVWAPKLYVGTPACCRVR